MKRMKMNAYGDLEKIKEIKENEFILDLEDCPLKPRERIMDFLSGLTFLNGSLKKLNNHEFEIKIVK